MVQEASTPAYPSLLSVDLVPWANSVSQSNHLFFPDHPIHAHILCRTVAIQFAHLSGFNPIITTSSTKHEAFLKSLGATHVLDRATPLSKERVGAITDKPIQYIFDAISLPETQKAGLDVLASGLLDAISPDILDGQNVEAGQVLIPEMYKLNVYGRCFST